MILSTTAPAMAALSNTIFTDVTVDAGYASAVEYCQSNGFMSGVSNTSFAPDLSFSRAMFVTALHRQAGSPDV